MFKSNKRRILSIFIMVLALIVLVPSFALSYFYFNSPSINDDTTINGGNQNSGIDDIEENYTGNKDDSSKEYTIYFFPSVLYTQYYYNQLTGITGTNTLAIEPIEGVNPEDWFGYNELTYDESSDTITSTTFYYDRTTGLHNSYDFNNDVIFATGKNAETSNSSKPYGDIAYMNFLVDTYEDNRDVRIIPAPGITDIYWEEEHHRGDLEIRNHDHQLLSETYLPYTADDFATGQASNGMDDYHYSYDTYGRDFGDPMDEAESEYFDESSSFQNQGEDAKSLHKYDGQFNYDNIYRYDRFGFWPENRANINPDEPFVIYKYYDVVYYNNLIFDYDGSMTVKRSSEFKTNSSSNDTNLRLGRYLPYKLTVNDYLPIDYYENLIDFPESDMGDRNLYPDNNNLKNPQYNYSFAGWGYFDPETKEFSVPLGKDGDNNVINKVFTSDNVNDTFDIMSNLEKYADEDGVIRLFPIFSNGKDYADDPNDSSANDDFAFRLKFNDKPQADLSYTYNIDNYFLRNGVSTNNISLTRIQNFRYDSSYNESDKYINVEASTANDYVDSNEGWKTSSNSTNLEITLDDNHGLYNIYIFAYNGTDDSVLSDANIKETISYFYPNKNVSNIFYDVDKINGLEGTHLKYIIAFERISDVKFIEGLDANLSFDDQVDNEKYNSSQSMLKQSNDVYLAEGVINKDSFVIGDGIEQGHKVISDFDYSNITYNPSDTPLNNDNIYLIKNINFTNYSGLNESSFQIKLNINSASSEHFIFNDPYINGDDQTNIEFKDEKYDALIYNPSGERLNDENIFIPASYYFQEIGNETTGFGFKPRHSVYLGMYDFILLYNEELSNYELYCYRHSNINVSVYSNNQSDSDNDGYVDRNNNELIWSRETFIGSFIEQGNIGESGFASGLIGNQTFANTMRSYLSNKADTSNTYYLRDHVTGFDLFKFTYDQESKVWNLEKLLNDFRIRKNYIFYITNEEPIVH